MAAQKNAADSLFELHCGSKSATVRVEDYDRASLFTETTAALTAVFSCWGFFRGDALLQVGLRWDSRAARKAAPMSSAGHDSTRRHNTVQQFWPVIDKNLASARLVSDDQCSGWPEWPVLFTP